MRKKVLFICIAFVCLLALLCAGCNSQTGANEVVAEAFGNGTFESRENDNGTVGLFVASEEKPIIDVVDSISKTEEKIYIRGHRGEQYRFYGLIDLTANTMQICVSSSDIGNTSDPAELFPTNLVDNGVVAVCRFSDFSETDRAILNELSQPE